MYSLYFVVVIAPLRSLLATIVQDSPSTNFLGEQFEEIILMITYNYLIVRFCKICF